MFLSFLSKDFSNREIDKFFKFLILAFALFLFISNSIYVFLWYNCVSFLDAELYGIFSVAF